MKAPWTLWRDRRGRISPLRIAVLALLFTPVAIALTDAQAIAYGARPINDLIHRAGFWALTFLLVTLSVTPLRRIGRFTALADVRRMLGVGAFFYIAAHLSLYIIDQRYDLAKVVSEITHRVYLTIGFTAWIGLFTLALTSTDGMVRRLGGLRWRRLHQAIYVIVLLALIHYFQQTKADVTVPTFTAGLVGWLLGYRLLAWWRKGEAELSTLALFALSLAVCLLTFAGEAIGIGIVYKVSPMRVLERALDFDLDMIRPGWQVLAAGLAVVAVDFARARWRAPARARPQPVAATR